MNTSKVGPSGPANGYKAGVSGNLADVQKKSAAGTGSVDKGKRFGEKDQTFADGGHSNHMFGEQAAGTQKPAGTAHDVSGGSPGPSFAAGGSTKMFGYRPSTPAVAGQTSPA
jgi:hypothetical protein